MEQKIASIALVVDDYDRAIELSALMDSVLILVFLVLQPARTAHIKSKVGKAKTLEDFLMLTNFLK